jgi:hypothetical protein
MHQEGGHSMQQTSPGEIVHNVLTTVLRAVMAIFLSVPIAGVLAAGVVEGIGAVVTQQFPATPLTHILAAAFGIVVAYASALTLAVIEATRGGMYLARLLEGDIAKEAGPLDGLIRGAGRQFLGRR